MPPPDTPTPVEGVNGQLRRYSTDSLSILPTNNLRLNHPADLGISNNIVISLTTTPTRATSQEIFDVLDSLVMQRRKAKKIFLAVPTSYKRPFAVKWEIERARFVSLVKRKYGNQIDVIDCEDNGPGTKLLGLLERAAESNCLSSKDIIIAVDDDIIYSDDLVRLHELCHDLYQCDVGVVDQNDVVASWIPLKFKRHNALFSDEPRCTVFGWLSFSIRYDKTKDLPGFFSEALAHIPNALYADDGVFSAYLAKFRLYVTNIKCAPLGNLSRTELDEAKWGALRKESFSHHTVRTQVEKDLENYIYDPARPMEPKFRVPPHISPRSILNCSRLNFSQNPDMHLSAHFVADDQALITITVFASALIGSEVEIEFQLSSDFFRFPIRIESPKFTIVVQTRRPLFERLNDHAELPIVQTNSNALVSQNKF